MTTMKDIPHMRIYRQKFYLPINEKSPAFNSMIIFNNLNIDASLEFLKLPKVVLTNSKYYNFYIDRLYAEKVRNKVIRVNYTKERQEIYDRIQSEYKYMKTPVSVNQMMKKNTYYDLSVYNRLFFDNIGSLGLKKTIEAYFTLLNKVYTNPELSTFTNTTICMNVDNWFNLSPINNPINFILIATRKFSDLLSILGDIDIVFYNTEMILRVNPSKVDPKEYSILKRELGRMTKNLVSDEDMDKLDDNKEINNDEPEVDNKIKDEIDNTVKNQEVKYVNSDLKKDEIEELAKQDADNDEELVMKVDTLIKEKKIGKSTASLKRDEELRKKQKEIRLKDKTVQELLDFKIDDAEIPTIDVSNKVVTTNKNVTQVRFNQFEKEYNEKLFASDTVKILGQLNDLDLKVYVKDIKIEDSSDSLNYKDTYKVVLEDENRVRHSLTFDVPKFVDDRYLYINGNKKIISKQLFTKPIAKTGPDEVQVCSNYNKIFINRYGQKYSPKLERFKKLITENMSGVKIVHGDASKINTRYKTILEYDIISESLISIKTNEFELLFNQDDVQNRLGTYKLNDDDFCIGFYNDGKPIIMSYKNEKIDGRDIVDFIVAYGPTSLQNKFDEITVSTKTFVYSRASIMSKKIPLIILLAYCEGLTKVLQKAEIKYYFTDKRPTKSDDVGIIQFEDGYLVYDRYPFENSLLLDGLTTLPTKAYQYSQFDDKEIFVDMFGDIYGARNLANAFDTFYEFMIDPITKEVLEELDYPTDFVSVLIVANNLLADNSYIMENNMNLYRVRSNEVVNALIHRELADAYAAYRSTANNTNPTKISIPKDAIIKKLLMINTVEEHSVLNPIYEIEKSHTISPRGLSGMNLDQAYTEDKRAYSETMLGVIGMSTSPDGNVGVARKLSMEPNIKGARGFIDIQHENHNKLNDVNLFTAAEMLTPMGASHDDAIRTAMASKQSGHIIPVETMSPVLISNGMEQTIQYNLSKDFVITAEDDGEVVEIDETTGIIIVKYKNGKSQAIDTKPKVVKNSSSGFYMSNTLNCDLKLGQKIKAKDVLAYDSRFFTNDTFNGNRFNLGSLQKVAVMSSYATFEDSTIITKKMSEEMATSVVMPINVTIGKNSNVYNMVNVGDEVHVGDILIEFDTSFEDDEINKFLAGLSDDMQDHYKSLAKVPIKSKYTGVIEDIKVYCTVDLDDLSPSLKKVVSAYYNKINKKEKLINKYDDSKGIYKAGILLTESSGKLIPGPDGKVKGREVFDGVMIEFYIKYNDTVGVGDKIAFYSALKSIVGEVVDEGYEPYSEFRPDEEVSTLLGPSAILARMVPSALLVMFGNKVLIELKRKLQDIYEN